LTVLGTYLVWSTGNKVQVAIQADANARISEAKATSDQANERSKKLENQNLALSGSVAGLQKDASDAKAKQQQVELELGEQQERVAEANQKAEDERLTRVELEATLAPRILPVMTGPPGAGKDNFEELKAFTGMEALFEVLPDAEANRAAGELANILKYAGMKIDIVPPRPDINQGFLDGVTIWWYRRPKELQPEEPFFTREEEKSQSAAKAIVEFLTKNNWSAKYFRIEQRGSIPPDSVKITVGFKPNPYFIEQILQKLRDQRGHDKP
jgi:hypothetical protein